MGQRAPVLIGEALRVMGREKVQAGIASAAGQRPARDGSRSACRRHPRHHRPVEARGIECGGLLVEPPEDRGIAPLQPHHHPPRCGFAHEQVVDVGLCPGRAIGNLAHGNDPGLATGKFKDRGVDQPVVHDDIRLVQEPPRLQRQEFGIPRPGTDQMHDAPPGLHAPGQKPFQLGLGRRCTVLQRPRPGLEIEARPEHPPGARLERLDPATKSLTDPGKGAQRRRQQLLDPGLDPAGQDRRGALGADGNRHRIAIDDGRRDEIAALEIVDDIDERPRGTADRHGASILGRVGIGTIDEGRALGIARVERALHKRQPPGPMPDPQLRIRGHAIDEKPRLGLQQQAQLRDRSLSGTGHDHPAITQIKKDREVAHGCSRWRSGRYIGHFPFKPQRCA